MTASDRLRKANTAKQHKDRMTLAQAGWISPSADTLTADEAQQLEGCEEIIENGLNIWYQVGEALLHIRDSKLYRSTHKTFEDYCQDRWSMDRRYANRLISASNAVTNLGSMDPMPENERQVRPLTSLAPDEQQLVWDVVQQTAPRGKVTAEHVKSVVSVLKEVTATGAIDDGTGVSIPVSEATVTHIKAAVTEETYERMARQSAHIAEKLEKRNPSPQTLATDEFEWYTPLPYLHAAHAVLGAIDLDPASSLSANANVGAARFYTQADDGLAKEWRGRIWLNPPYGAGSSAFVARLMECYAAGDVTEAIVLVNANSCDARWFQPLWDHALCFTDHRIDFISPHGNKQSSSTHGSVFVYLGTRRNAFIEHFRQFGAIVARVG